VERTRLLVHLVDTGDTSEMDPVKAFEIIESELAAFSESLTQKPSIVVATKLDATTDRTKLEELRQFCKKQELAFHAISAATGEGVKDLVRAMADALDKIPKEEFAEDTEAHGVDALEETENAEGEKILGDFENEG
jgi:GTP-binding protein